DVAKSGRTILFVSHNMAAVENLCNRVIVLNGGTILADAPATAGIAEYCKLISADNSEPLRVRKDRKGNGVLRLAEVRLKNSRSEHANTVGTGDDWELDRSFEGNGIVRHPTIGVVISTITGTRIARMLSKESHVRLPKFTNGSTASLMIRNVNLLPGS